MAAEKTPGDHMALCLGSGGGGPNRAVSEDTGNEDTAAAEERRQVARYKQTLWEFKLSAIVIVLVLAFWVAPRPPHVRVVAPDLRQLWHGCVRTLAIHGHLPSQRLWLVRPQDVRLQQPRASAAAPWATTFAD
ncbi:hypothetical protein OsI_17802 [Oryza sativa Indica Group]|uniref:Uncharacterized protein n=2 Tax=Oryza sativa TaxID=4530 RepID=A2XYM4_ORYSI|nr:hypothetical protein OsI_17802 [Oryza sativa Indica Group]CAH66893.1 OSIGBa0099L20.8 [Oryza sativa]